MGESSGAAPDVREVVVSTSAAMLGVEDGSLERPFVELGGDSLVAISLASVLTDELGIDVPVELIFDLETLDDLAAELEQRARGATG